VLVPSRAAAEVFFKVDLAGAFPRGVQKSPQWHRPLSVEIIPEIEGDSSRQKGWRFTASVRRLFHVNPNPLDLGELPLVDHNGPAERTATMLSEFPVTDVAAQCPAGHAKVEVASAKPGGRHWELRMALSTSISPGALSFPIEITAASANGKDRQMQELWVTAKVLEELQAHPAVINFGVVPINSEASAAVTVRSPSKRPLHIRDAKSRDLVASQVTMISPTEAVCKVTRRFSSLGPQDDTLEILIGRPDSPGLQRRLVPIRYFGVLP